MASKNRYLFTSESVTEGHPDKIADQISDAILDACLTEDSSSRVACETLTATGLVVIAGEITTKAYVDFQTVVRGTVASIGYDNALYGFDANTCAVISSINKQSGDIAMGVDTGGAGDQGMMFGYACDENLELMPTPISLAHKLTMRLSQVRKNGTLPFLRPDGKSQVTVEYDANGKVLRVDAVVVSTQHSENVGNDELRAEILKHVIQAVIPAQLLDEYTKYHINPTGRFVIGGPMGDTGLTGRKIIVDTYGGMARHGGGAENRGEKPAVSGFAHRLSNHAAPVACLVTRAQARVLRQYGELLPGRTSVQQPLSPRLGQRDAGAATTNSGADLVTGYWLRCAWLSYTCGPLPKKPCHPCPCRWHRSFWLRAASPWLPCDPACRRCPYRRT